MPRYTVIGLTTPDGRLAIADVHEGACVSLAMGSESQGMVRFTHFVVAQEAGHAIKRAREAHRAWYTDHSGLPGATTLMSAAVTDPGFTDQELVQRQAPRRSWWRRMFGK